MGKIFGKTEEEMFRGEYNYVFDNIESVTIEFAKILMPDVIRDLKQEFDNNNR